MKAKLKSGKVISGRLAETFTRIGIAKEVGKSSNLVTKKPKEAKTVKSTKKPKEAK